MIENHMTTGNPERDTYDPEPYRQAALDSVIETIMLYGQWPQPRMDRRARRCEFSLCDWIVESMEPMEIAAFMVGQICMDENRDIYLMKLERSIEEQLRAELAESGMVDDVIDELYHEEREER